MDYMFYNCINLEYINLKIANTTNYLSLFNFLNGVPENLVYCINVIHSTNLSLALASKKCSINYCLDDWKKKQKNKAECEDILISDIENTYISDIINTTYIIDTHDIHDKSSNKSEFYEGIYNNCLINIKYINEEITNELIRNYILDYISKNSTINSIVNHYINNNYNFTITIFRICNCTNLLLKYDYFEINSDNIVNKIKYNINNLKDYVIIYINYKYKNYFEIYDLYENKSINIRRNCNDCFEKNNLKITNNFTEEINSILGKVITNKIIENNINIFNTSSPIFNNICENFTIEEIDIPIKERRQILFLGNNEKEIICNDINCDVQSFFLSNLTGICNCQIFDDLNNLFLENQQNANNITEEEYKLFINSNSIINSFLIFKCGKEAFNGNNIKNNIGFYISCIFIIIQIILFCFHLSSYLKSKNNINLKLNPPKIKKFEIDDDLKEEKEEEEKDKKLKLKNNNKISEKKNNINIGEKNINTNENMIKDEKNIINININSVETMNTKSNLISEIKIDNMNQIEKDIIHIKLKENKDELNLKNNNNILFSNEENIFKNKENNILNNNNQINLTRNTKFLKPINKNLNSSKESLIISKTNNINNKNYKAQIKEQNNINKDTPKKQISFFICYWQFLSLKQPIINLLSPIKCLKIEESNIPILVKLMRILFYLSLNIFFIILHLEQKYFRNKYEYFNKKYNIRYEFLNKKISLNERFSYGFIHSIQSSLISFFICFIIQSVLNYFFFNIKKILNLMLTKSKKRSIKNKKNNKSEINEQNIVNNIIEKYSKLYLIFFSIGFIIMIIIFYSIIAFNQVYRGGYSDFIAGTFWTFIFLQIIPFILCFIFASFKYIGNKNNNKCLSKIGEYIYF